MKQDKGRGVVVMNKSKYTEKCLHALQTEQFTKLRHDPTKSIEKKKNTAGIKEIKNKINNARVLPVISHRLKLK